MQRSSLWDTIGRINVRIHWTFWLLMFVYAVMAVASGGLTEGILTAVLFGSVFACVLAHEYGHAIAAAAFGIPTYDITLLPIGGLARLARLPDRPHQELIIALAGPAVNVVIALGLILLLPMQGLSALAEAPLLRLGGNLVENLLVANVALVLFNLLPAFPMDGGRVLRSILAMRTSHLRATEIAAKVGRWMSLLFVIAGFVLPSIGLLLVGAFVFLAGTGELMEARRRAMATAHPWAQFTWFAGRPGEDWTRHAWSGSWPAGGYADVPPTSSRDSDVIDAVEVREVKRFLRDPR